MVNTNAIVLQSSGSSSLILFGASALVLTIFESISRIKDNPTHPVPISAGSSRTLPWELARGLPQFGWPSLTSRKILPPLLLPEAVLLQICIVFYR
jgi:hypothetical protein